MTRKRRLDLSLVTFTELAVDDQKCVACWRPATWLVEFIEKRRWWDEHAFGLCLRCIESADADPDAQEWPSDYQGWVYFIRAGELVKIGYSTEPDKRLSHLATASPLRLELWGKTRGDPVDERALHLKFAKDRAHGEWFHISDGIRSYVASIGGDA